MGKTPKFFARQISVTFPPLNDGRPMIATIPMILQRINPWKFAKLGSDLSWVASGKFQIWGDVFR